MTTKSSAEDCATGVSGMNYSVYRKTPFVVVVDGIFKWQGQFVLALFSRLNSASMFLKIRKAKW